MQVNIRIKSCRELIQITDYSDKQIINLDSSGQDTQRQLLGKRYHVQGGHTLIMLYNGPHVTHINMSIQIVCEAKMNWNEIMREQYGDFRLKDSLNINSYSTTNF